jgi:hypothetical protein
MFPSVLGPSDRRGRRPTAWRGRPISVDGLRHGSAGDWPSIAAETVAPCASWCLCRRSATLDPAWSLDGRGSGLRPERSAEPPLRGRAVGPPARRRGSHRGHSASEAGRVGGHPRPPGGVAPDEITEIDGIPTTTVARTLLDLAAILDRPRLERAIEQAEALRLSDATPLAALVARHPGRRGTAVLKRILGAEARAAGMTRSELEDRFLRFLADRGLPVPRTNVWLQLGENGSKLTAPGPIGGSWWSWDSWAYHGTKAAFRRDRARDRRLRLADGSRHGLRHGTSTRGRGP